MTIADAILWLQRLEREHGGNTRVYFDCPTCEKSFEPAVVEAKAVHIKADEK